MYLEARAAIKPHLSTAGTQLQDLGTRPALTGDISLEPRLALCMVGDNEHHVKHQSGINLFIWAQNPIHPQLY